MACLTPRAVFSVGAGIGRAIQLSRRLQTAQGIVVEGMFIPDVPVPVESTVPGGIGVVDTFAAGPVARARFAYLLRQSTVCVDLGLELSGGILLTRLDDLIRISVPLGASIGIGLSF